MEHKIPEWITADFLKQSLQSDVRYKDISISDLTASMAAPAGNNYGSLVVRVTMDCTLGGRHKTLSVIVKGPLTEGVLGEIMKEMKNSESSFYNVFLPAAYELTEHRFAPEAFYSTIPSVVVMEDLKAKGYLMADRIKQLDFDHCRLYTNTAAAFHAASIALYKQNPEMVISTCGENFYSDECKAKPVMETMNKLALECMASHISDKRISNIVKDSIEYMWRMLVEIHNQNDRLNSLLQFDPWTTNMMFKYDSRGNVCDIKLLDFQNVFYSTPVHDLVFFIWYSANSDVRKYRLRDLYSNYFNQLNTNLRNLNCPEMDYDSFMYTIREFSPLALSLSATIPTIIGSSPADFTEIINGTIGGINPMERYYDQHFCHNILPQMIDHLAAEGVFDYMESKIKSMKYTSS